MSLLMMAFTWNNKNAIEYLLSLQEFENKWDFSEIHQETGYTLLHFATAMGDIAMFKTFLEKVDLKQLHSISHNIFDTKNYKIKQKQVVNTCTYAVCFCFLTKKCL